MMQTLILNCGYVNWKASKTPYQIAQKLAAEHPRAMRYKWCVDLLANGHARRVYRLVHYLQRCTDRVKIPKELYYKIAELHYGSLSAAEQEIIKTYCPDDYKKERKRVPVNNTCQS